MMTAMPNIVFMWVFLSYTGVPSTSTLVFGVLFGVEVRDLLYGSGPVHSKLTELVKESCLVYL